ncbi:MAG: DUF1150 family protein [Acetobacteraceae bacterium]|nr:DUF1150 family protein [Acetobacteraceae bacterium]
MNIHTPDGADPGRAADERLDIRQLTAEQLAKLGIAQVAYVKAIIVNGAPAFAIHAADGTPMAVTGERDVAVAAIQQHDMLVVSVH